MAERVFFTSLILPNPPPPQINSPPKINSPPLVFAHRDDPPAAVTDISVTRGRGIQFGRGKMIVLDPVLGVLSNAAAQRPLWADDLLTLPCDHHVASMTKSGWRRFALGSVHKSRAR